MAWISAILVALSSLPVTVCAQESIPTMMNQVSYAVMFDDRVFQINVMSDYDLPEYIEFSQEQRSISLELSNLMVKDEAYSEMTIPNELLSGEFTGTLDGKQIKFIESDKEMGTTLHVIIMKTFIESNGIGNSALMVVTGTQVIPEFPDMVIVFVGSFAITFTLLKIGRKRMRLLTSNRSCRNGPGDFPTTCRSGSLPIFFTKCKFLEEFEWCEYCHAFHKMRLLTRNKYCAGR
jgi:hypothetical protein